MIDKLLGGGFTGAAGDADVGDVPVGVPDVDS